MECSKLRSVTLGANVSKCDYSVFNTCSALEKISVSSENATFFDDNGVLYEDIDKENRTLVHYPSARADEEYEILNGTTSVAISAFEKAKNLKLVTFPDGVREIGDDAFYGHNTELVIAAPSGSAAESYAEDNEITFKSTDEGEKVESVLKSNADVVADVIPEVVEKVEDTKDSENDGITSNTEEINKNDSKSEDESNKDDSDKVEDIDKDESGKDDSGNTEENDGSDNIGEVDSENTETEEIFDEESGDKESADLT